MFRRLLALALIVLSARAALATTTLPDPGGPFAVGFQQAEFNDPARARVIPALVWYPARTGKGAARAYLSAGEFDLQMPALARSFGYDVNDLAPLRDTVTHAVNNAPPAGVSGGFPLIIFSPGFPSYPAQNTVLMEALASHGYIVVALAHLGDAADFQLADGRIVPTVDPKLSDAKALSAVKDIVCCAPTHDARTAALKDYINVQAPLRIARSTETWRQDTLFVAGAMTSDGAPETLKPILATANAQQIAFVGMSFGGNTAANSCRRLAACKAAINFDGGNSDPEMFNADVARPYLLLMSDWMRYPSRAAQPMDPDFSPLDYSWEPWASAGLNPNIIRVRIDGIRHMGFTDLLLLMGGAAREKNVGGVDAAPVMAAINRMCLAFLDHYLKGRDRKALDAVIDQTSFLHRHKPDQVREWAMTKR